MNLVLLYNPRSGAGTARRAAEALSKRLSAEGHAPELASIGCPGPDLAVADALIVLGGDGTVHSVLHDAVRARVPLFQVPMGTENLFARQFGMDGSDQTLVRALASRRVVEVDVARCNGRAFIIMCSAGPDASIVHRLARNRGTSISHMSYIRPIAAEFADPAIAPISVRVDGLEVVSSECGWLVVANSRQYALRLDPAPEAAMDDRLLDIAFFPCRSMWSAIGWAAMNRLRVRRAFEPSKHIRGREVRIESPSCSLPLQLDGEVGGSIVDGNPATITLDPSRLRVLVPA